MTSDGMEICTPTTQFLTDGLLLRSTQNMGTDRSHHIFEEVDQKNHTPGFPELHFNLADQDHQGKGFYL